LTFLLLGHYSAAIVELHGWLERYALEELPNRLGRDPLAREVIADLIKRRTLAELIEPLIRLGLWNADDKSFVSRLKTLRDGIVHKNFALLSKHLADGKWRPPNDLTDRINEQDCIGFFLTTIQLLMKLKIRRRTRRKPLKGNRSIDADQATLSDGWGTYKSATRET
jgi:hypothetical protein